MVAVERVASCLSSGTITDKQGKEYDIFAHEDETIDLHVEKTLICFNRFLKRDNMLKKLYNSLKDEYGGIKGLFGAPPNFEEFRDLCRDMVRFHDAGKLAHKFQIEKMNNLDFENFDFHDYCENNRFYDDDFSTDHSYLSTYLFSVYMVEKYDFINKDNTIFFLFPYIIYGHHTGLKNPWDASNNGRAPLFSWWYDTYDRKDLRNIEKSGAHDFIFLMDEFLSTSFMDDHSSNELWEGFNAFLIHMKNLPSPEKKMCLFFLYNYLYSLLIKSDVLATSFYKGAPQETLKQNLKEFLKNNVSTAQESDILEKVKENYRLKQKNFKQHKPSNERQKELNEIRDEMKKEVFENYEKKGKNAGMFFLKMPTGGGKTNVSLGLAKKLLENTDSKRVIYSLPYRTLLEQNYDEMVDTYGLKQHDEIKDIYSNSSIPPKETKSGSRRRYFSYCLEDVFEYPFICTTNVSLLTPIIKFKRNKNFRFSSLARSIIIVDEVQTLNQKYWFEFAYLLYQLVEKMGCYVILMSATLPDIDKLLRMEEINNDVSRKLTDDIVHLIDNPKKYYKKFKRNKLVSGNNNPDERYIFKEFNDSENYKKDMKKICQRNFKKDMNHGVIVVNTVRRSTELYDYLKNEFNGAKVWLLNSTILPERRREIKYNLKNAEENQEIVVVSTQSIECGMDISFHFAVRDKAPLESIEQVRGRCNREFKKCSEGKIYTTDIRENKKSDAENIYSDSKMYRLIKTEDVMEDIKKEKKDDYTFKDIENYFDRLIEEIKKTINEETFLFTPLDNLKKLGNLRFTDNNDKYGSSFYADVIESDPSCLSFFVELSLPLEGKSFNDDDISYLEDLVKKDGVNLFVTDDEGQRCLCGRKLRKYYESKMKESMSYEMMKEFTKSLSSIISNFVFSTYLSSRPDDICKKWGPYHVIPKEFIKGHTENYFYSKDEGFNKESFKDEQNGDVDISLRII